MNKIRKFEGLVAAPFTPMHPDGSLNLDLVPAYHAFLAKNGLVGAFIGGSSGEGPSLTRDERRRLVERWAACGKADGRLRLIALVGGTSYGECIENAVFCRGLGLAAIAVVAPYYFKPADAAALADFVSKVGAAVPDLPLYFYHIPALSGVSLPMIDFLGRIADRLPSFAGIKFTHVDFMDFLSCLLFRQGAYDMLWGYDETLLPALAAGARGAIGSTYNYAAPLYQALMKAFDAGDLARARELQRKSIDLIRLLGKYGGIAVGKAYMRLIGLDCGPFRSPVTNMDEAAFARFREDVDALDMAEWFSKP